jgi:hypothetical protein
MKTVQEAHRERAPRGDFVARWIAPVFVLLAVALLPWTLWLGYSLPARHVSEHYRLMWVGFDVALAFSALGTGIAAVKRSPWLEASAAVTGTLLLVDAWFDVLTADGGRELMQAVVLATLCEIPGAIICFWMARSAERFYARTDRYRRAD